MAQQVNKATAPTPSEGLWSMDMGSSAKVGAGMYPAKWLLNSRDISCGGDVSPDFVVYNTGLAGSGTQASIIAYDNLYSGCTFEIPLFPVVYWQYNTDGGTIVTSPVLSADGTQVAFVQSVSSVARLVLLKWSPNSSLVQLTASPQVVTAAAGKVYLFVNGDGSGHGAVYQLSTSFASGATGTQTKLGQGVAGKAYSGAFDNIYMTSSASSPSGNLYVCGRASGSQTPTLYQLPITSNVMGTPVVGPALASSTADCSPITEYFNTSYSTDWIFLSLEAHNETASPISCPSGTGCIMSFDVTSGSAITTGTTTSATLGAASGTSGIIIDSSVTDPAGASNVYFSTLGNQACTGNNGTGSTGQGTGGCAVQATQQGLD